MSTAGHPSHQTVVVGLDSTPGSRKALDWALNKIDRFGPVKTVTAYRIGPFGDGFGTHTGVSPGLEIYREAAMQTVREVLEPVDPKLCDNALLVDSAAGPALVEAASFAALLVVGSRERSAIAETILGSVGSYCVKHSTVPVAVIAGDVVTDKPLDRVVVAVDGSDNSRAALQWGIDHVEPDGVVTVVGVYNPVSSSFDGYVPPIEMLEQQTRASLDESVADVVGNAVMCPKIELEVRAGDPRNELRDAAADADLLVVGSRGHRGVAHLLMGSVTTSLLHHPTVPTVVVPY